MFQEVITKYRRWKTINVTIRELNQLDNRELNDIGISRWRISEIAHRMAG